MLRHRLWNLWCMCFCIHCVTSLYCMHIYSVAQWLESRNSNLKALGSVNIHFSKLGNTRTKSVWFSYKTPQDIRKRCFKLEKSKKGRKSKTFSTFSNISSYRFRWHFCSASRSQISVRQGDTTSTTPDSRSNFSMEIGLPVIVDVTSAHFARTCMCSRKHSL